MNQPTTPGYNLKKKYIPSPAVKQDHSLDSYAQYLKGQGLWVHPSIKPAFFSLSNGLLYPGLKTEEDLAGPHLLVKVPKNMLLNTKVANIPPLQKLFKDEFYSSKHFNWEDRIIVTFLLYTYSQKQQSVWFQMVNYLSKDIDILSFWPEQDIKYLSDPMVQRVCKQNRLQFDEEYNGFLQAINKHPGLIPTEFLAKENYLWLFVHLVSRSFGKFLEHVTMVPFCELFNHHNADVLYDFIYNQDNPLKETQSKYEDPALFLTQEARAEISSSDGSYNSEQYFDEDQFNYSDIQIHKIKWGGKVSFNLKDKETNEIEKKCSQIFTWLEQQLFWDDHSIVLIAQVVQKINIAKNQYMAGRKKYPQSMQSLTKLRQICHIYKTKLQQFYKTTKGDKFIYRSLLQQEQQPVPTSNQRFKDDKFDHFTMRMNKRDHFEADNQVYFCYGRLSNRMMLERYGMAIEGNKYDHIWITLPVIPFIEGYPDTIEKMQERKLSIKRKFKLKRRQISLELLVFFRMSKWDLMRHNINSIFTVMDFDKQIDALNECLKVVDNHLQDGESIESLQQKLKDKQVGYHQYFGIVYRLEHKRILELHKKAYNEMKTIIEVVKEKGSLSSHLESMQQTQQGREMRWYLSKYIRMIPN